VRKKRGDDAKDGKSDRFEGEGLGKRLYRGGRE